VISAASHGRGLGWSAARCVDEHRCDEVYLVWLCDRHIRAARCCGPPCVLHNLHSGRASSLARPRSALPPRLSPRCTLETPGRRTSRTARHHLVSPLVAARRQLGAQAPGRRQATDAERQPLARLTVSQRGNASAATLLHQLGLGCCHGPSAPGVVYPVRFGERDDARPGPIS